MEEGCVCHGEYNQHNVLMVRKKTAVTSFEHWGFDIGSLDNKWNIQEAGSYRITIDQLKETISIVKQ